MTDGRQKTVLVADDEIGVRESLRLLLSDYYRVILACDGIQALEAIDEENVDLVILDIVMPKLDGMQTLRRIKKKKPRLPVIMVTAYHGLGMSSELMENGAYDCVIKPFNAVTIKTLARKALQAIEKKDLHEEVDRLKKELQITYGIQNNFIIARSPAMEKIRETITMIKDQTSSLLIQGESGTGKELIARTIHYNSSRRDGPFIDVHCAAVPETLIESELFGHEKGAFTGASAARKGVFELADGGTLLLDEIGELDMDTQVKLLRVLQEKSFRRVGGTKKITSDVRLIAATNKNLEYEVQNKRFRQDLYYRLNVIPIHVPPLRERREDIPLLVTYLFQKVCKRLGKDAEAPLTIGQNVLEILESYDWPGNVRELENMLERLIVTCKGNEIAVADLAKHIDVSVCRAADFSDMNSPDFELKSAIGQYEKELIERAFRKSGGSATKAMEILKLSKQAFYYKVRTLDIDLDFLKEVIKA